MDHRVPTVLSEKLENLVTLVMMECLVHQERLDCLDKREPRVHEDLVEMLAILENKEKLELRVLLDQLDLKDHPDLVVLEENKEHKELRAKKVPMVPRDQVVHQEHLDDQVYPVNRVAEERMVYQE